MKEYDEEDLKRSIKYKYSRVKTSIEREWTEQGFQVSVLDYQFLRLTEETIIDGVLINASVRLEDDGPVLANNLETVPQKFEQKMDLQQVLHSRILKCKNK